MEEAHPAELTPSATGLKKFLGHPAVIVFGIVGSIASLISIPLAVYFYRASTSEPSLIFYVHPVKAVILQSGQSSKLSATYDNKPLQSDVTAAQVVLWNNGARPIKGSEVLSPITVTTQDNAQILEASIKQCSRDVIGFTLATNESEKAILHVSWKILEQNDGCMIQIIYAGGPNNSITASGVIEGQPQIINASPRVDSYWVQTILAWICFVIGIILTPLSVIALRRERRKRYRSRIWLAFSVWAIVYGSFLIIVFVYLIQARPIAPPFVL